MKDAREHRKGSDGKDLWQLAMKEEDSKKENP